MASLLYSTLLQRQGDVSETSQLVSTLSQLEAVADPPARQAALRDQVLAAFVNGAEMNLMLQ